MFKNKFKIVSLVGLLLSASIFANTAQAALIERGPDMVFDSTQNITWLRDANLNGAPMLYNDALAWASNLNVGGYDDWRLFATCTDGTNGCLGGSELGHLFFNEFNISAGNGITTASGPGFDLFRNIQVGEYWVASDNPFARSFFDTQLGSFNTGFKNLPLYAWAVRNGDSVQAEVSAPSIALLIIPAFLGLIASRRRKHTI